MTVPRYRYQPTTDEIAAAAGIDPGDVVRFDHNTSPLPTEWAQPIAARHATHLNEYPAASYRTLRGAAGGYVGLAPDHIIPGAGIDELILLCARAFLSPGAAAAAVTPTYPLYRIATAQVGASFTELVMAPPDFGLDTDALLAGCRDADLVWLCVPSNPIGSRLDDDDIRSAIAATSGVVVVDAAYAEFAGDDWAPWVDRHRNLVVLHTLSKAFGLAGARVGFAMAHPDLIDAIDAVRPPGSISTLSLELALAALSELPRMRDQVGAISAWRDELWSALGGLGWRVLPSHTNFVLCEVGPNAGDVAAGLLRRGMIVRTFPGTPLQGFLRVTARSPEEHARLLTALRP